MRQMNALGLGAINLRAQFSFNFREFGILSNGGCVEWKIPVRVQQARYFVFRTHRSPAKTGPLTVESLVNSDIGVGVLTGPLRHLGEPRAGNQDAGRRNPSLLESLERGPVDGMVHAEVVRVNHQQTR